MDYGPIFGKVHWMTSNDLDMVKVKNTNMHGRYTPEAQFFVRFALRLAVFELRPNFRKSAPNDLKWPWHVQGQNYKHACYIHSRCPYFRPFRSTISRFLVTTKFSEKCTEWPQMTLTWLRSKIPICMLHTPPEAQICVPFALRIAVFELRPNFRKSAANDPNIPWHGST